MKQKSKFILLKVIERSNSKGFSIIQILITLVILGVVSVAINNSILSTRAFFFETRGNILVDDLHAQIVFTLSNRHACFNTFSGMVIAPGQVAFNQIMSGAQAPAVPVPVYVLNTFYNRSIQITSMTADTFTAGGGVPAPFTGFFRVTVNYLVRVSPSSTISKVRRFIVRTETNPANTWAAGSAVVKQPERCHAAPENGTSFGFNPANYLSKTGIDTKSKMTTDARGNTADEPQGFVFRMTGGNLSVGGDLGVQGGVFTISDKKLKQNMQPLVIKPKDLMTLNGYSFQWKEGQRKDIGFVAQEVESIFPEVVSSDEGTGIKRVDYQALLPILLEATKSIDQQNIKLERKIQQLESLADRKLGPVTGKTSGGRDE
tara:strand:+ start:36172 stop:37293 length:1122 start_codon:yes stop_codon:yes gene_type:complete